MLELVQTIARPSSVVPLALRVIAVRRAPILPFLTTSTGLGVISTVATGVRTVTVAESLFPSAVAVTVVVPSLTPVTSPDADTVATDVFITDHENVRPVSSSPTAERAVAVNCNVALGARFIVVDGRSTATMGSVGGVGGSPPQLNAVATPIRSIARLRAQRARRMNNFLVE
jgi:hypothetical protein